MAATTLTAGELRKLINDAHLAWTVDDRLKDDDPIPAHKTGADLTKVPKADAIPRVDIRPYLAAETKNPFLLQQRIDRGFIKQSSLRPEILERSRDPLRPIAERAAEPVPAKTALTADGTSASVDWRNRFGWPWLTDIKDQGICGSCWCFGAVGVVEAMTRIEHTMWSLRSEGDVHDGMAWACANGGWPTNALDWMKNNGVADPGCWPYEQQDLPYRPTPDRSGRTVRFDGGYVQLNNAADVKSWIDNVGPVVACFNCYWDFQAYGPNSGVYTCNPASGVDGGHCIIVVGYDDSKQAWLIRNSWSMSWGMSGYCWFHYGDGSHDYDLEHGAMVGVPGPSTNPDPWTKRRVHNGGLYESGDGPDHRNFELWTMGPGNSVVHRWRDGTSLKWAVAETQGNDCASHPCVSGTTFNRNFEMVYQNTGGRMHHRFFDQATGQWRDGPIFGPFNTAGVPGFIQSDYGAPGNFEVVVRTADGKLAHWWRNEANFEWNQSAVFGDSVALSAATLVQRWDRGLDVIVVNNDGTMQRYWRDDAHGQGWAPAEKFGAGVKSPPVMVQGQFGASDEKTPGNYELCVAVNGVVQHWWRPFDATAWNMSTTFGANVSKVVGLIESSFGFDLEVIVQLNDGSLQHFWRNNTWHAGPFLP